MRWKKNWTKREALIPRVPIAVDPPIASDKMEDMLHIVIAIELLNKFQFKFLTSIPLFVTKYLNIVVLVISFEFNLCFGEFDSFFLP